MCVPCAVGNMLRQTGVNLYHFMWWRVVCDEAHEIMVYSRSGPSDGLKTVIGFQSRHRWYVSGTPFPHGLDSLRAALQVHCRVLSGIEELTRCFSSSPL